MQRWQSAKTGNTNTYNNADKLTRQADLDIYGKVRTFAGRSLSECTFRYQGQYEDSETGLYYNRFRYYSPDEGMYLSQDPIGLEGNNPTFYAYVDNPNLFVDVFGLLAKAGEDLYVGTYNQSSYGNKQTGLNKTHTPHHSVQDALSGSSHGKGITINLRKDLHGQTRTFSKSVNKSIVGLRNNLAADVKDLRKILKNAGYSQDVINAQLSELIKQNKAQGEFEKPPKGSCH